jgi:ABC-type lipoprotein export system ATPase subunit
MVQENNLPLVATDVAVYFRPGDNDRIDVISNLSFHALPGTSTCFVGRSGSGKTSILRALAGISRPQEGSIEWWGTPLASVSEEEILRMRRQRVGYVDQESTLIPDLSALENVLLPLVPDGRKAVTAAAGNAKSLLAAVGLKARIESFPRTLSGGERQRVALARALLREPELLIVDEPTASLDARWADEIIALLGEYRTSGCAIILASHDRSVIASSDARIEVEPDRGEYLSRVGLHTL